MHFKTNKEEIVILVYKWKSIGIFLIHIFPIWESTSDFLCDCSQIKKIVFVTNFTSGFTIFKSIEKKKTKQNELKNVVIWYPTYQDDEFHFDNDLDLLKFACTMRTAVFTLFVVEWLLLIAEYRWPFIQKINNVNIFIRTTSIGA